MASVVSPRGSYQAAVASSHASNFHRPRDVAVPSRSEPFRAVSPPQAEEDAARALKEKVALEQEVAALKARIKMLEANAGAGGAAAMRIGQLQKQLKSSKQLGAEGDGSKACVIS